MYSFPQLSEAVTALDRAHTLDGRFYAQLEGKKIRFYDNVLSFEENKPLEILPLDVIQNPVWVISQPF